jgi:tripartite-type tricarboxylate transporter receptor subunit TctC
MATHSRRRFVATAAALGASVGMPGLAFAQTTFPDKTKTIKGIVPFSAGSTVDTLARAYAQALSEILGTNVVIDNRPGAEAVIGLQAAKTAPADGYTILFTSVSSQSVNPHLFKQLTYDPIKDFTALGGTMKVPFLMIAGPNFPFKSVKDFVVAAKAAPDKYSYASISATTRLAGEMFARAAGVKLLNVPYKTFADLISDTLANRVNFFFADGGAMVPYVAQGMRGVAACTKTRITRFPDIPTMESEGVPFQLEGWHAAYAPANTPPAVLSVLRDALRKAESSKVVKDYLANGGNEPMNLIGEDFAKFERSEYEKWGKAVRDAGLAGTL